MNIFVIGSGGWGTAASIQLSKNGHDVMLCSAFEDEAEAIIKNRENTRFLPGVRVPEEIEITTELSKMADADVIVVATPSFAVKDTAEKMSKFLNAKKTRVIVCLSKGFDRENGYCLFSETFERALGKDVPIAVLTGPSHAEEVGRGIPTLVVAAAKRRDTAELVQSVFMSDNFRVYTTPDIIGAELGGALKNIVALAAGICEGLGLGDNTKAALMTRGITEMARLGVAIGGKSETFAGLSGLGDMIVTCTSMHSRNNRAGILIGKGMSPEKAISEIGSVVEGYFAAEAGYNLAKKAGIEMPICEAIYNVLYKDLSPKEAIYSLMTRKKRHEIEEVWMEDITWE